MRLSLSGFHPRCAVLRAADSGSHASEHQGQFTRLDCQTIIGVIVVLLALTGFDAIFTPPATPRTLQKSTARKFPATTSTVP